MKFAGVIALFVAAATAAPVLGDLAGTVTGLASNPGAAVVVQESLGHCALGSARSKCTEGIAREYMHTGKVPSHETVCDSDFDPWKKDTKAEASGFVIDAPRFIF
ncbi:hypothetical protein NLG97_g9346 [Lecanicillium saksenae]|uniref:Uncharacterized protein n=1 Tax=Lecanicillium saksenae TaxID=468837 RepID=A0ACC1QJ91_9HYPO|nr:hypothetical protein NLG97_g9346 [Lecanicillium saksenae]